MLFAKGPDAFKVRLSEGARQMAKVLLKAGCCLAKGEAIGNFSSCCGRHRAHNPECRTPGVAKAVAKGVRPRIQSVEHQVWEKMPLFL